MLTRWKESYNKPRRQRHHFANKGLYSQSYGLSSSHVGMWEADHKEGWTPKNWCFRIVVLEKTLESPLDSQKIKPDKPKGNQHWIFTGKTHAERSNTLATWCEEPTHCKRPSWERLKAGGEGVDGEPYGWTASTIWVGAWIWANSGRQWRDREAWHAAVHGVAKTWTWLNKNKCTCAHTHTHTHL